MQANKEQIANDLKKMLVEDLFVEIPPDKIKDTDALSTDLGLDSVGQIELVSLIEERYGLKLDAAVAAADMKTFGSATDFVFKHLQAGRADEPVREAA